MLAGLLPTGRVGMIRRIEGSQNQLHFSIRLGGKTYSVGEYPGAGPNIAEDQDFKRFVKRRRKFKEYVVLEVVDPGTKAKRLYYVKKELWLIVLLACGFRE